MRMFMKLLVTSAVPFVLITLSPPGVAQDPMPYAGFDERAVKALSDQEVADLRAGRGMSFALPAELNGYPGPAHVLENAHLLKLTAQQQDLTKSFYEAMKGEAVLLGERLIEEETMLDRLFADGTVTPANLSAATRAIGLTQASLRATHLKYHLVMMQVLTADQIAQYRTLRGYAPHDGQAQPHKHVPDPN